jgi:acetyl esterase/lipase
MKASASLPPEKETTTEKDNLIAGQRVQRLTNISSPTMAVYLAPAAKNTHAAVVVFPGGGYRILAYDLEGTEVCDWLNGAGVNCVLVKYRVPGAAPFPEHPEDLADAQRAVRLTRQHAAEWGIDPKRVGVLGFSAGGHLAAVLGSHAAETVYPAADAADALLANPDFAIIIYPGYLVHSVGDPLAPEVTPNAKTPPTFLIQAEDDPVHVENTTVYYQALKQAKIPAEMHVFAEGGHGYGLRPTKLPVTHWPDLAIAWLHTIGILT